MWSSAKDVKVGQKEGQEESEIQKEIEEMVKELEDWCGLKRKLLDVAREVCGYTKGKPKHF